MVTHMPLSEMEKLELYKNLMSCMVMVLKDRTVFILVSVIIILSDEENACVLRLKNGFVTLLRKYLLSKSENNIEETMNMIFACINTLPVIRESFAKILSDSM